MNRYRSPLSKLRAERCAARRALRDAQAHAVADVLPGFFVLDREGYAEPYDDQGEALADARTRREKFPDLSPVRVVRLAIVDGTP